MIEPIFDLIELSGATQHRWIQHPKHHEMRKLLVVGLNPEKAAVLEKCINRILLNRVMVISVTDKKIKMKKWEFRFHGKLP